MKLSKTLLTSVLTFALFGNSTFSKTLKVGASPVPHGEILEVVKPELAKKGIDLEIIEFNEYVTPNLALADKSLDANFFQHIPYLEKFREERNLKISSVGDVIISPIAIYSNKYKSLEEIQKGDTIAIPSDPSNGGRALLLLHNSGVITLKDPTDLYVTEFDIVKNPKKLKFKSLEAAQLPRVLKDVDFAVINGNYAMEANLNPTKDALVLEGKESPYANIVAVREKDLEKAEIKTLIKVLQSEKVADFIEEKYNGSVVKAF